MYEFSKWVNLKEANAQVDPPTIDAPTIYPHQSIALPTPHAKGDKTITPPAGAGSLKDDLLNLHHEIVPEEGGDQFDTVLSFIRMFEMAYPDLSRGLNELGKLWVTFRNDWISYLKRQNWEESFFQKASDFFNPIEKSRRELLQRFGSKINVKGAGPAQVNWGGYDQTPPPAVYQIATNQLNVLKKNLPALRRVLYNGSGDPEIRRLAQKLETFMSQFIRYASRFKTLRKNTPEGGKILNPIALKSYDELSPEERQQYHDNPTGAYRQ